MVTQRQDNWNRNKMKSNEYEGNMIMQQYIVEKINNKYEVRNSSKRLRNQLKFLKQYESEIVHKLRSESRMKNVLFSLNSPNLISKISSEKIIKKCAFFHEFNDFQVCFS